MKETTFTKSKVLKLAKKAYQQGKASFDIIPENCVLLVIDIQDEFVKLHLTI
jgi:hypothetical protein